MKIRDSGMPDESMWASFFTPVEILTQLGFPIPEAQLRRYTVVDFGCGYGTFTLPAAGMMAGEVIALDIEPAMLDHCRQKATALQLENIQWIHRDFLAKGTGLPEKTVDYCMLFNIMHTAQPVHLLEEAYRILKSQGKAAVLHWNYDATTPRGPAMNIRPKPEQVAVWLVEAGFQIISPRIDLPPYHYGFVAKKVTHP